MSPNITVNSTGIAVTSTSCSGLRRIFIRARHASVVIWLRVSRTVTDSLTVCAVGRDVVVGIVIAVVMTLVLAASPSVASCATLSMSPAGSSTRTQASTATNTRQPQDVDDVYFLTPSVGWASEHNSTRLLMTTD